MQTQTTSYRPRALEDSIRSTSRQFPVLLVTGPRQVGKTTLLKQLSGEERAYVTLDDLALRELAARDPVLFLQRFPPPVLIDEIQYAPELLPYIKIDVDQTHQPGRYWLTGSQQFHMMRGVTESLAGRVAIVQMLGFSNRERDQRRVDVDPFLPTQSLLEERLQSGGASTLDEIFERIWLGSFPGLLAGSVQDRDLFYSSYLQTYIQRDVRDLAQIGNQASFFRFLRACAARTGQLLNLSDLARDTDIAVSTAREWLSILETGMQIHLLRPYFTNTTKRLVKTPKLYFLDTGLCAYLTEWSSPATLATGAMAGSMLETWVFGEIYKSYIHRLRTPYLHFYRDKDGQEIDLLFAQDGTLFPLEIKMAATPKSAWTKSFAALDRFQTKRGPGAVLCLAPEPVPLSREDTAFPVGAI